jgi:hypothetical protein
MKSISDTLTFEQEKTRRRMAVIKKLNPTQLEVRLILSAPNRWTFSGNINDNIKLSLLPNVVRRNRIQRG